MVQTRARRAAAEAKASENTPSTPFFDLLSDDDLHIIIGFLNMQEKIIFSMCSKQMSQLPMDKAFWGDISFPPSCADKVTDAMLRSLLTRVNALEGLRSLSLRGCTAIKGSGFAPLIGSEVLEIIDLRLGLEDHLNPGPINGLSHQHVRGLVMSCKGPRHKLEVVKLRRQRARTSGDDLDTWDQPWQGIMTTFRHHCLHNRKMNNDTQCGWCENRAPAFKGWALELAPCSTCRKSSCCQPGECPYMIDCSLCLDTFCGDCDMGSPCGECGDQFCEGCRSTCPCDICGQYFCETCRFACFCDTCELPFCEQCREVNFCDDCGNPYCSECRDVSFCDDCNLPFCTECRDVTSCDLCNHEGCGRCREGWSTCDLCNRTVCRTCWNEDHDICDECYEENGNGEEGASLFWWM